MLLSGRKVMLTLILPPHADPLSRDTLCLYGRSPCTADCRALLDAVLFLTSGRGISEKRTSIEILMINVQVSELNGIWRWTDTHQQLADGMTKLGVRQFDKKLRRGVHGREEDWQAGETSTRTRAR